MSVIEAAPHSQVTDPELEILKRTWASPSGFFGWFTEANNSEIGKRFIITALVFFVLGAVQAALMRLQLARPENAFLSPEIYNEIFTMHGTTMMFLFALPFLEGLALYVVPQMIGTPDMAFPRLSNFGYNIYLIAGILAYAAFFAGVGADAGWFSYPPLASSKFTPGLGLDIWSATLTFLEISALVGAIELIATILKQRAPGMSLHRMPLFVWSILVMSVTSPCRP